MASNLYPFPFLFLFFCSLVPLFPYYLFIFYLCFVFFLCFSTLFFDVNNSVFCFYASFVEYNPSKVVSVTKINHRVSRIYKRRAFKLNRKMKKIPMMKIANCWIMNTTQSMVKVFGKHFGFRTIKFWFVCPWFLTFGFFLAVTLHEKRYHAWITTGI